MVQKKSKENVSDNLDITDELIAERRTSTKMPKDMDPWMAKTIEFIDRNMLVTGKIDVSDCKRSLVEESIKMHVDHLYELEYHFIELCTKAFPSSIEADKIIDGYYPRIKWLGSTTDFADSLKDGTILCAAANNIRPGICKGIKKSKMPFIKMENIGKFISAVSTLGVRSNDSFMTIDLYEQKNMVQVVNCILALKNRYP